MKIKTETGTWINGKKIVTLFLFIIALLLSLVPNVYAEGNPSLTIYRHEGYSRDNVAENVAQKHFATSNKVILVNREKFPDAISATNISQGKYPVLYTHEGRVTEGTIKTLKTMPLNEIYILGGEFSINKSVENQLINEVGVKVTRISGRSRYDANISAIKTNFNQKAHVVIASGEVYSDALYGVSYANTIEAPVILTKTDQLEASTIELLKDLGVYKATIIGGTLTVTAEVEKQLTDLGISHNRIAGRNRYIGSAEVATASYKEPETIVVASGEVFADALVSAPLAQKLDAPILLVQKDRMEDVVETYIMDNISTISNVYVQGGTSTIQNIVLKPIAVRAQELEETVTTRKIEQDFDIEYEEIFVLNQSLKQGESRVEQEGKEGKLTRTYLQTLQNGHVLKEEIIKEQIKMNPIQKIIHIGVADTGIIEIEFDKTKFNEEVLNLVNEERARHNRSQLYYEQELQRGVDARTLDSVIIKQLYNDHSRPDKSEWFSAFNYLEKSSVLAVGENIAFNTLSNQAVQTDSELEKTLAELFYQQYVNSKAHYENMLKPSHEGMAVSTLFTNHATNSHSMRIYNTMVFSNRY